MLFSRRTDVGAAIVGNHAALDALHPRLRSAAPQSSLKGLVRGTLGGSLAGRLERPSRPRTNPGPPSPGSCRRLGPRESRPFPSCPYGSVIQEKEKLQTACTSRPRRSSAWPAESSTTGSLPPVDASRSNEVAPSIRTLRRSPCADWPTSRSATAAARSVVTDSARESSEARPASAFPTALTGEERASAAHAGGVPGPATTFGSGDAAPPGPRIGAVLADVGGEGGSAEVTSASPVVGVWSDDAVGFAPVEHPSRRAMRTRHASATGRRLVNK